MLLSLYTVYFSHVSCSVPLALSNFLSVSVSYSHSLSQIEEEFRRITLKLLQSTFLGKLDQYTPKLLSLYRKKGGAVGRKLDDTLDLLN